MDRGFSVVAKTDANASSAITNNHHHHQKDKKTSVPNVIEPNNDNNDGSPDSGSLYSDEIPSGYNSGEQYDTLSTGYMSGEAYELPDTRMDLHEPALDVIEECLQPLDKQNNDDSDAANIFVLPGSSDKNKDKDKDSSSETSDQIDSGTYRNVPIIDHPVVVGVVSELSTRSPNYGSIKSKLRKKVTTFAIPIENAPLNANINDNEDFGFDPESSDANNAPMGGYRAVPSDTDTSAFDSDANAINKDSDCGGIGGGNPLDSGSELLQHATIRPKTKADRIAQRKAKKNRRHDEDWFNANDGKYWAAARQTLFWCSIAAMIASSVAAAVLIYLMPRTCDPVAKWYQGAVFMDVAPDDDNGFDLDLHKDKLETYRSLGVRALHLKDLTAVRIIDDKRRFRPSTDFEEAYKAVFGLKTEEQVRKALMDFVKAVHDKNLTVIVHVPIVSSDETAEKDGVFPTETRHAVERCVEFWAKIGADGVFIDGLERFAGDKSIATYVEVFDKVFSSHAATSNPRVIMTSYKFAHALQLAEAAEAEHALSHIGLLDATLDLDAVPPVNETEWSRRLSESIDEISEWDVAVKNRPWINWNLRFVGGLPLSDAALAFQTFLPGTISVDGAEVTRRSAASLANLTRLRTVAVPIHMNGNYRRSDIVPIIFFLPAAPAQVNVS